MAWNSLVPTDDGLLLNAPGQIRANWDAIALSTDAALLITNAKVLASAAITESKLLFSGTGHSHTGGTDGKQIPLATAVTGQLPIANGGSAAATANSALNNFLPAQTGNANKLLKTDGTNTSWGLPNDLAINSQAQGDIIYFNGTNWVRLAAGTSGYYLKTQGAGANPVWSTVSVLSSYIAGETVVAAADTQRENTAETYTKVKEITLNRAGNIRVKFDLKRGEGLPVAYGQIYKNAVAIGTERSNTSDTYITYTEDFSGIVAGDKIQLYAHKTGGTNVFVQNFRICSGVVTNESVDLD